VKRLQEQKEMEDMLNSLKIKEAKLENEYPKLKGSGGDSLQDVHGDDTAKAQAPATVGAARLED